MVPINQDPPNGTSDHHAASSTGAKRPIRIAGCSGGVYDRKRAIHDMAKNEDVDVITGDWMSECNMTLRGSDKRDRLAQQKMTSGSTIVAQGYEPYFLEEIDPAIPWLAQKGVKIAVNAGASDVHGLAEAVDKLITKHGVSLKIGIVDGDDVTDAALELYRQGEPFLSLPANKPIQEWGFEPICAQCYLGGTGIAACFQGGADIVLCGRVADASVTLGAAMWWHGWTRDNMKELAGALMIGHIIECSTYATGGYYSGFKDLGVHDTDMGYPIAAIDEKGEAVISMEQGKDGLVSIATVASQLLYEIQGPLYYNSDVTASIEDIVLREVGENQVHVSGVKGLPPPSTTKVGLTAKGGWQAEFHFYLTGLDIEEKLAMIERQTKARMGSDIEKFSCLKFMIAGVVPENPCSQEEATVDCRIFAQSADPDILSGSSFVDSDRGSFARFCIENLLQGYPGSTMAPDMRTAIGRPFFEYWVSLVPQTFVHETAHLPDGTILDIPSPTNVRTYEREQPSYDTQNPIDLASLGPTTLAPLGYVVMGRSGDKSSNCNLGLFVRHDDEWDWLRSLLSTSKLRELLGRDDVGRQIDRCEFPNIRAVHFLLKDHLDRGFNSTSSFDSLGKNLCEYIRCKHVEIPNRFLDRGEWEIREIKIHLMQKSRVDRLRRSDKLHVANWLNWLMVRCEVKPDEFELRFVGGFRTAATALTMSHITVERLQVPESSGINFGATITNVDIEHLTDADFDVIREALFTHQVVIFKNQSAVSPKAQFELTRRFDPAGTSYGHGKTIDAKRSILHPDLKTVPHQPQVQIIGNGFVSEYEGLKDFRLKHPHHKTFHATSIPAEDDLDFTRFYRWHIDAALYGLAPPVATTLLAVKVPGGRRQTCRYDDGTGDELDVPLGTTAFVSGYTMYDILSDADKEFARTTKVEYAPHPYIWMSGAKARSDGLGLVTQGLEIPFDDLPPIEEEKIQILPICWRNPVTGKLAIQVHPAAIRRLHLENGTVIEDLAEVRQIIYRLQRPGIAPNMVYAHDWEEGDFVLFHNRGVLHSVVGAFAEDEVRLFRQCNIAASHLPEGPRDVAAAA
ncbi:hypothetical protein JX266_010190 [Neoarthrinium moseri]|nr:hypothetical protein JX266_010190 [Neoarthrinium moseri]